MTKEEAISTLSDIRSEYNCFSHVEDGRYHALSMGIEALKEQNQGVWMPIIEANEFGDAYQCGCYCSECGEELQCEPNYCPNCGADMRGDSDV